MRSFIYFHAFGFFISFHLPFLLICLFVFCCWNRFGAERQQALELVGCAFFCIFLWCCRFHCKFCIGYLDHVLYIRIMNIECLELCIFSTCGWCTYQISIPSQCPAIGKAFNIFLWLSRCVPRHGQSLRFQEAKTVIGCCPLPDDRFDYRVANLSYLCNMKCNSNTSVCLSFLRRICQVKDERKDTKRNKEREREKERNKVRNEERNKERKRD